jgi:nicotinamidase-related amidase
MKRINGLEIPENLEEVCDPRRMALLVYDMQAGICSQVKNSARITSQTARLIAACRAAGVRVVYTRHLSLSKAWMGVMQYRSAMAWQHKDEPSDVSPWFLRGTPGFEIVPELAPHPDDTIFDKLAFSAFEGTPLEFALRDAGIRSMAIAGIATEIGIEPTVRHAADIGIIPVVVADACGAGHEEAGQRSLDSLRFMGDAVISDVPSIEAVLRFREK